MRPVQSSTVVETERLVLRAPTAEDAGPFIDFMTSDRARFVGGTLTEPGRPWRVFATLAGHWVLRGCGMFVITRRDDGRAIGMAGPWFPDGWPEREIGYSLWSGADEGQGFASEAVGAARDLALGTLGWDTAVSYIDPENAGSIAVARRLGAVLDPSAPLPVFPDPKPIQVWRHRKGAA